MAENAQALINRLAALIAVERLMEQDKSNVPDEGWLSTDEAVLRIVRQSIVDLTNVVAELPQQTWMPIVLLNRALANEQRLLNQQVEHRRNVRRRLEAAIIPEDYDEYESD
jgi:hypothetical protein